MRPTPLLASAAIAACLAGCPGPGSETPAITIKGSDTMVHVVSTWAEAFMKANPGAEVSVTGGGSGTGIAALINGTTDVAMSSRDMKAEEEQLAGKRGARIERIVVGLDGIAIVVHPENPIAALTLDQLRQVFNGTLKRWDQVGGPDQPIQVLSRESSSGTYAFFKEHVLKNDDFGPEVRLMPSTAAIVQSTGQDRWSIGYVGLGYASDPALKVVPVKADANAKPLAPSVAAVKDGTYPIARELLLYAPAERDGVTKSFIEFALSAEGQRVVALR
jgi:phosphate transport system substrate-binding protein